MGGKIYIRRYKELMPRMLCYLYYNLTLNFFDSGMRAAIRENRGLYSFIAFRNRKIFGWSIVYKGFYDHADSVYYSIGVFVVPENRHQGLGNRLKRLAMRWSLKQELKTVWYDAKNNWVSYYTKGE